MVAPGMGWGRDRNSIVRQGKPTTEAQAFTEENHREFVDFSTSSRQGFGCELNTVLERLVGVDDGF